MIVLIENDFGLYRLKDPIPINEGGFQGPCLRAEYQTLGESLWREAGDFRTDRIKHSTVELELKAVA